MAELLAREPGIEWNGIAWEVVPVHEGPTWVRDPAWDGVNPMFKYILPEYTLGWEILRWMRENLCDPQDRDKPFTPTFEQARIVLWWYAIDERGRFVYREGVLTRLKGWGKDPLAAALALVELCGPCRFKGWARRDMPERGLKAGDPVGKEHPNAWIQIAAVSKDQTRNTSTMFPALVSDKLKAEHGISLGKEIIYAHHGARRIECVTSSPAALEGGRPTFVIMNETHHWMENNDGHDMSAVIERNATKSRDGSSRALAITNAYDPAEDSVAKERHESYQNGFDGDFDRGVLYDTLEAPPDAKLRIKKSPVDPDADASKQEIEAYLEAVIKAVRGDATWLNVERIIASILDRKNPASRSRRFWLNQVVAAEDAWVDALAVAAAVSPLARQARDEVGADHLRFGWHQVLPEDEIVMFFDGSKSNDATGLVGVRLEDGYTFTIGVWQQPRASRTKKTNAEAATWLAPRGEIDLRVEEAFKRFNVIGFWADPSHAQSDEDSSSYWRPMIDDWHRRYKARLDPALWALKSGKETHSILFDMSSPTNIGIFIRGAEQFVSEMEHLNDIEEFEPLFRIDGHPALVSHLTNAKANPMAAGGRYGVSLMKENRSSLRKIDLAVCAVGARTLARVALNVDLEEEDPNEGGGELWGSLKRSAVDDYYDMYYG